MNGLSKVSSFLGIPPVAIGVAKRALLGYRVDKVASLRFLVSLGADADNKNRTTVPYEDLALRHG